MSPSTNRCRTTPHARRTIIIRASRIPWGRRKLFPTRTREKPLETARRNGANQVIVDQLNDLPDKNYHRAVAVSRQISRTQ
ncbi:DUF2795 domain-containing protein [Paraburkholderia sp. WC7.3g]|uniref:DUF2795 domain-containing protein n=1 Tax=Paraburkholderia sp. WC7.3g TaxID=2991070 RepID=UPI003D1B977A